MANLDWRNNGVNLDIELVELPEKVLWVDDIHKSD